LFAAVGRMIAVSILFGSFYVGAVILLHWGTGPIRQFVGLVREMISRKRSAEPLPTRSSDYDTEVSCDSLVSP